VRVPFETETGRTYFYYDVVDREIWTLILTFFVLLIYAAQNGLLEAECTSTNLYLNYH